MSKVQAPNRFGKTNVPPLSSIENTATYTVSPELFAVTHPDIVAYYTFPGLEDYLKMPSAIRNMKEESYLLKDISAKGHVVA